MKNSDFAHLHVHSEFSQLDGLSNVDQYAERAKGMGFKYLACTDHGNIDALIKFQKACEKNEINPVLGCELYVAEDPEKSIQEKSKLRGHMQVHVKSQKGFKNLCTMLSYANQEGFYYKPLVSYDMILKNCSGLIFSTACLISFARVLPNGKKFFSDLYDSVGKRNLYCEIMPHKIKPQQPWNRKVIRMAKRFGLKTYASNDCHYVKRTDATAQEVLLAIQRKAKWADSDRFKFTLKTFHMKSANEMKRGLLEFNQYKKEYLLNTLEVAEKCCKYRIPKLDIDLPPVPGIPKDEKRFFKKLCYKGFEKIFNKSIKSDKVYFHRFKEEFELITKKKFERYFLMVWELINWCNENKILVGPGRGSVGGSLIAYLIGITKVDPILHDLIFSRFIKEDRIDYPDIDVDFEYSKRHLVRQHLETLYGEDKIAGVSSFNRMKAKAVLKDVGRVFGVPWQETDVFTKLVEDNDEHTGIQDAIAIYKECREYAERYPRVIKLAKKLEGTVRGYSQHAAALVLSNDPISTSGRCNLILNKDQETVVNWEKEDTEYVGLMKLDALALKLLSVLSETMRLVKQNQNKNISLEKININDKEVLKEISNGNTVGVFQLGTWAMTNLIKEMGTEEFKHISDAVALVRPGPANSGMTEDYIKRKHGEKWEKMHPIYEKITKDTYGLLVYQEQVMQVISEIAGLPYTTADKIRKIIGKKRDVKEFNQYRKTFINGCKKTGYMSVLEAKRFWKGLEKWASYGFNKAHSVEYALLGIWCSWLKKYFPTEFICGSLTHTAKDKKAELVEEAYRLGLALVLPKVGISHSTDWTVNGQNLYVPFKEVKGIGEKKAIKAANAKLTNKNIKRFYKKNTEKEVEKFTGAFGELLTKIGAYDSQLQSSNLSDDVKELFKFRITANPRIEYKNLYNLFGNNLRLNYLDPVLSGDERILKKFSKKIKFIKKTKHEFKHKKLKHCEKCELINECRSPVYPSWGMFNIVIVGEAPGSDEDKERIGFIGRSGEKIWSFLKKKGFQRSFFHVTNVAKCYPNKSRKPNSKQIKTCGKYLDLELRKIKPRIILAFGNTSLEFFTGQKSGILSMSGKVQWNENYNAWIVWCLHPAATMHNHDNKIYYEEGMNRFCKILRALGFDKKSK